MYSTNREYLRKIWKWRFCINGCSSIISKVAERLNCSWDTARKYIYKWTETTKAFENERQRIGDFAESKLIDAISNDDLGAIKYLLSKKFKDRGYGDEQQLQLSSEQDNAIHIILD